MKGLVLLILGFVLGIFTSYGYSQTQPKSQIQDSVQNLHSNHMMSGMPSMNSMLTTYSDLEYLRLMIIHHQDALDMAQKALMNSTNEFVRTLSQNIIKSQSEEINQMKVEMTNIIEQK